MALFQVLLWAVAAQAATFWPDVDRDGYGDALGVPNGVQAQGYVSNDDDCDDTNALVHPGALEQCNNSDENCDGVADDRDEGSALVPGCVPYFRDVDEDGWGRMQSEVCLCPVWIEANGDADGLVELTDRWTPIGGDCGDYAPNVHPATPDTDPTVEVDGFQPICGRGLPIVELDCDNDGAFPWLPDDTIAHATDVGLASCVGLDPPTIRCFGDVNLPLDCDAETGLWLVSTEILTGLELFQGAMRVGWDYNSGCGKYDCDDQCAARCFDREEACDGVDNDCTVDEVPVDANQNGLPDAMETNDVDIRGTVPESEAWRTDLGQIYECDDLTGPQVRAASSECYALEVIPAPADDTGDEWALDEEPRACGCSAVGAPGGLGLLALAGLMRRRRR